ncbi:MAG TPA: DUF1003 domain-containing protein [Candidatus Moranbacteria bacterium]|nr:DUF1003 domain-containing protein [Candidatus Moranbacteria bacterium]
MIKTKPNLGQKSADKIAQIVGSWKFIIFQSILFALWIILNISAWINHWDPYPFIFLNLILGLQSCYTAPIILMSENRQAERDRRKEALDLATDRKAEREIEEIKLQLNRIEKDKIDKILKIINKNNE